MPHSCGKMSRYPHTLTVLQSDEATQDDNGNFIEPESYDIVGLPCREESSGGAQRTQVADGVVILYSSVIYLPYDTPAIPNGVRVQVSDKDGVRMDGVVKRFIRERKNCRLWA